MTYRCSRHRGPTQTPPSKSSCIVLRRPRSPPTFLAIPLYGDGQHTLFRGAEESRSYSRNNRTLIPVGKRLRGRCASAALDRCTSNTTNVVRPAGMCPRVY
eukprot:scaffold940_cov569-Prasinococcus_capsulatus_cf.AAC.15